jgi:carboxyl-terminal processing protease
LPDATKENARAMERWQKVLIGVTTILAVALASFSLGYSFSRPPGVRATSTPTDRQKLDVVDDAFAKIKSLSVDPPSGRALARGAVRGMAEVVRDTGDDYASFFSPRAYTDFQELTTGRFSGIGVWLKVRHGRLEVVSVLPGAPAIESGIRRGDLIESVDGEPAEGLTSDEAVALIKGPEGTEVTLGVERDGASRSFTITREAIALPNLLARHTSESLGYIRLYGFARGAASQLRSKVETLTSGGAEGIILDLRDNSGGLLNEGIEVASVFLENGEVASYKERSKPRHSFRAKGDAFEKVPLVVLVNEGTASASEIVTGALQDSGRAVVVGTPTYGKGSVQEVLPLRDSSALKLTIGAYFTPDGRSINGVGIDPDIEVDAGPAAQKRRAVEILEGIVLSQSASSG